MNKINKLIFLIIFIFVCAIGFSFNVSAEDSHSNLINMEKIRLEVEGLSDTNQQDAYIRIYDAGFDDETTYLATFTKDTTSVQEILDTTGDYEAIADFKFEDDTVVENAGFTSVAYLPAAEKYGDIYVTFYALDASQYKKISDPILVKKPENLKISKRFKLYPNEDETTIFYKNLGSISTERSVDYKIGKVTDKIILNQIKNGDYSGLESLLTFAKSDTNSVTSGTIKVNSIPAKQPTLYKQTDLLEDSYYYVYLELDDEDGKYYELNDVNIYQCLNNNGNLWLASVDDSQFKWNVEENDWEKFIRLFKESEKIKKFDSNTISYYSDDTKFVVTLNLENSTYNTQFNYKDGIVSYEANDSTTEEAKYIDSYFIQVALDVFTKKFEYNFDNFIKYMKDNPNLTIDKNGIEYSLGQIYLSEEAESSLGVISGDYFKVLKFNLLNGSKSYEELNNVNNPKTGLNINYGILGLLLIMSGVIYLLIRKYSKFPKHN